ncbi:MAG TPA: phosphotransferase [Solirubrobacteraceae bacterium]|nr:phosphotransferase [Solirubrobacteraceae bacterium]
MQSTRPPSRSQSADGAPADDELRDAVRAMLAQAGAGEPTGIARRRSEYRSSFPLEELKVELASGGELRLALKRLAWDALSRDGRLAKPRFLFDAAREPAVYRQLEALAPAGPPRYMGSIPAADGNGCWLLVEWVAGRALHEVGEFSQWVAVARWLGAFHAALARCLEVHVEPMRLLDHDAAYYRRWMQRAREFAPADDVSPGAAAFLEWLSRRHDGILEALLELPRTVIHGDFNAANVLVSGPGESLRVAPVDWELAASGPGLMDLAALISGGWSAAEQERMVDAYAAVDGVASFTARALLLARLQLAVQWLGWAPPEWIAPEAQRHDWLADASELAERLEI